MTLRDWDEALLPRWAAAAQRTVARLAAAGRRIGGRDTPVGDAVRREPALAGSIVAVAVAALVLLAAGGPGEPSDHDAGPAPVPQVPLQGPSVVTTLGPTPGTAVSAYVRRAASDLRRFAQTAHGKAGFAVVDLRRYQTIAQTGATFSGVTVVRAYVRVPPPHGLPTQVHAIPLERSFDALSEGMRASGRLAAATANTFHVLVSQLDAKTPAEQKLRSRYAAQEQAASYEARQLEEPASCTCVFAVVVRGRPGELTRLTALSPVRVVDPASAQVTLDELTIFPLAPEIKTTVPRSGLFGA